MKKLFAVLAATTMLFACDFVLKDTDDDAVTVPADKKVVMGTDKDAHGCVTSAGYKWSLLRMECVRVFEEGYRLNTIEKLEGEETAGSAFVIFDEKGDRAELFLPGTENSLILERSSKDAPYKNGGWSLQLDEGYALLKNGMPQYAGAKIQEQQITGDDNEQS